MEPERFFTASLRAAPWGATVARILAAAINAVEPAAAVRHYLQRDGDTLHIGERAYNLADYERVFVVGAGKAGAPMAQAAAEILDERLTGGVVIVKEGHFHSSANLQSAIDNLQLFEAGHPVPDQRGIDATQRIADMLAGTTAHDQ